MPESSGEPPFSPEAVIDIALWLASDTRIVDVGQSLHLRTSDATRVREACWDLYKARTGHEGKPNA